MNRFKTIATAFTCIVSIQLSAGQNTPLHRAVERGVLAEVQELLRNGANPNAINSLRHTPLNVACNGKEFNIPIIQALLAANAKPNFPPTQFTSPLHRVASWASKEAVYALLEAGANPDATCSATGDRPLHQLVENKWPSPAKQTTVAQTLLTYNATVDATNKLRETPLHAAAKRGGKALATARVLIAHGADVRSISNTGHTPLDVCSTSFRKQLESATRSRGRVITKWAEQLQKHYGMPEAVMRDILLPCVMPEWQAKELIQAAQQKRAAARQRTAARATKRQRTKK